MKTYNDAVKLLTSSGKFRISLGLERMERIMELLGNPQDSLNCIHVAGTNGKGSVCAIIGSILNETGIKVGVYSSPHIFKYTERIRLATLTPAPSPKGRGEIKNIPDNIFAQYVFEITEIADKNNIDLTEFEILTAVMFKYFADNDAEVVVLETGLGGRFDATNIIKKNLCSVITHIDYDHTERLGKTLDEIAFEKAGIIKPNCPCIVLEGREAFYDKAMEVGAELEIVSPLSLPSPENLTLVPRVDFQPSPTQKCCGRGDMLALKGVYQQENLSLALAVVERCFPQIGENIIKKGLQNVKHPCRFEYIADKNLIIDGAHNPNGIKGLMQSLDIYYPNTKRRFIFGCLRNKEYGKMVKEICKNNYVIASPNVSEGVAIQPFGIQNETAGLLRHFVPLNDMEIYFYHFSHQNSATFEELKAVCPAPCKELTKDTKIDFNDGHLNIICGSFYMLAELTKLLGINLDSL